MAAPLEFGAGSPRPAPTMTALLLAAGLAMLAVAAVSWVVLPHRGMLTDYFLQRDRLWLLAGALVLLVARRPLAARLWSTAASAALRHPRRTVAITAVAVFAVCAAASVFVFAGYGLSRDEAMADFDAAILRGGHLIAHVPAQWRGFVPALEPEFRFPIAGDAGWVSGYLPGNAALRALFGFVADPILLNPALAAICVLAIAGVARQLWPERPQAAVVAALMLASSSQLLAMAGTSYAMTAHLALDLVWLWLFLRGGWMAHALAIAVGFVATGLHQILFHPLYAAPFIARLWLTRRWACAGAYTVGYLAIGLFWIAYRQLSLGTEGLPGADGAGSAFVQQIISLLQGFSWSSLDLMAKNLIRFAAWQNPLVVPLAVVAVASLRRADGIGWCLVAGVALTLAAVFVLMPYQGHGWGYRYLHGLLGSVCLLATGGWLTLADRPQDTTPWSAFAWPMLFAVLVMMPGHLLEAKAFAQPYATAWNAISRADADVVMVDASNIAFGADLVRNDPYLRNRPKVVLLANLAREQVDDLCRRFRVALFDTAQAHAFGLGGGSGRKPVDLRATFAGTACAPQPPPAVR